MASFRHLIAEPFNCSAIITDFTMCSWTDNTYISVIVRRRNVQQDRSGPYGFSAFDMSDVEPVNSIPLISGDELIISIINYGTTNIADNKYVNLTYYLNSVSSVIYQLNIL